MYHKYSKPPLSAPACSMDEAGILTIKWRVPKPLLVVTDFIRGHVVSEAAFEPHKHSWLVEARRSDHLVPTEVLTFSCTPMTLSFSLLSSTTV